MLSKEEVLQAWAPTDSRWSPWAKPVLFAFMDKEPPALSHSPGVGQRPMKMDENTAVVVDLPGLESVDVALQLASSGYRPVPLFNAYPHQPKSSGFLSFLSQGDLVPVVDMAPVLSGLFHGANKLQEFHIGKNAPPAFCLDSRRHFADTRITYGMFDNRSAIDASDVPSGPTLIKNGIRRVMVIQAGKEPQEDLKNVLLSWQAVGIEVYVSAPGWKSQPEKVVLKPPSFLQKVWFRLRFAVYRRHRDGGFGRAVSS
jgi:hypothetical protein